MIAEKTENGINLNNVYQTAMVLVEIDPSLVKLLHSQDFHLFREDLIKALDDYEKPFTLPAQSAQMKKMTKLDKYLSDLLKATQNIYHLLTDEGKNFVEAYLKG